MSLWGQLVTKTHNNWRLRTVLQKVEQWFSRGLFPVINSLLRRRFSFFSFWCRPAHTHLHTAPNYILGLPCNRRWELCIDVERESTALHRWMCLLVSNKGWSMRACSAAGECNTRMSMILLWKPCARQSWWRGQCSVTMHVKHGSVMSFSRAASNMTLCHPTWTPLHEPTV